MIMIAAYNLYLGGFLPEVSPKNSIHNKRELKNKYKMKFLIQQERKSVDFIFKFGLNIFKSIWIIYSQNPDVIISKRR